jgi:vitamin B12 transporter
MNSRPGLFTLLLALGLAVACPALAEDPASTQLPRVAETVVVSANATPTEAEALASSITVIDAAEIDARKATSVLELLRTVPGLEVDQAGGPGRAASVFIRGAASSHTLVLIDGVRVNSPATGAYDLADLRSDQIERIEILRGPQSSLYGSEAMGGVIQIFTRRFGGGPQIAMSGELGGAGSGRLQATAGGASRSFDYRLTASSERLDGLSVASAARGNTEADPYRATSATGFLGVSLGQGGRAELSVRSLTGRTALDGFAWGVGPVDDLNYTQDRHQTTLSLRLDLPLGSLARTTLRLGSDREELLGRDPDTVFNNYRIDTRVSSATWQADLTLSPRDVLSVGVGRELRFGANRDAYRQTVGINSMYAENQLAVSPRLNLTAAVRYDDHSLFGGHATYRATIALRPFEPDLRLHASFGTAFKAPTFNDLYFPDFGNPSLAPETSRGWDAGLAWEPSPGLVMADLTYFDTAIDDLIGFDFTSFRAANIDRARSHGIEATVGLHPTRALALTASYTYTGTEDLATGQPLPRRPRHRATLSGRWTVSQHLAISVSAVGVRDRIESDGSSLDNYARVDAGLEVTVSKWWAIFARAENLLNAHYEELAGYTSPGFLGSIGVTLHR